MKRLQIPTLPCVLTLMANLLVFKVTVGVVLNYRNYFPPNFNSDFLSGRESYFFGAYQWSFYLHLVSGPASLLLGLILVSERFRRRFPRWHRCIGRVQAVCVLFVVAPSGLCMSYHATTGAIAGFGFASLSIATGTCVALGWRSAAKRQFVDHRRWMWRCFLLLCSAIVLRLFVGLLTVLNIEGDWIYPSIAWSSWLVPLVAFELFELFTRHSSDQCLV